MLKDQYTLIEVSKVTKVALRTVSKWLQFGTLKKDEALGTVSRVELESFCVRYGIDFHENIKQLDQKSPFPEDTYVLWKDGTMWCASRLTFEDLMVSKAGFGETPQEAIDVLCLNEAGKTE